MKRVLKWFFRTVLTCLILVVIGFIIQAVSRYQTRKAGEEKLNEVIAKLDAEDPGWRLDDILAAREAKFPPDDRNVMSLVQRIHPKEPEPIKAWGERYSTWLPDPVVNNLPDPTDVAEARKVRNACIGIIEQARKARHMTEPGGYKLEIKPNPLSTLLEPTQNLRGVVMLLTFDAAVYALDGKPDLAIESAHAALNTSRGLGDEPILISMLIRIATTLHAVRATERILAWGEPKQGLAELQATLAAEAEAPLLHIGLRGERAFMNQVFENLDSGVTEFSDIPDGGSQSFDPNAAIVGWHYRGYLPSDRAKYLETLTRLIEIARLPIHDRLTQYERAQADFHAEIGEFKKNYDIRYYFTILLTPAWTKFADADMRVKATTNSSIAALACERFRQANGRWPNNLAEIPKSMLTTIPLDPYDGQLLRYQRTDDGVVIYSVGRDIRDDGGDISKRSNVSNDIGFRLWDVKHRRAAPLPKPPPIENPDIP